MEVLIELGQILLAVMLGLSILYLCEKITLTIEPWGNKLDSQWKEGNRDLKFLIEYSFCILIMGSTTIFMFLLLFGINPFHFFQIN